MEEYKIKGRRRGLRLKLKGRGLKEREERKVEGRRVEGQKIEERRIKEYRVNGCEVKSKADELKVNKRLLPLIIYGPDFFFKAKLKISRCFIELAIFRAAAFLFKSATPI